MPLSVHRFPLNLADPCTRGWGGAYLNPSHASYWVIVTALLPSMYDATIGPFLTPWVGLWLPLWCAYGLFLYLRRLAYFNPRYAPRPRVICDPRGITLHDAFGRIRHQWRWAALTDVRYQRGMQHGLLLEPQQDEPVCYRSGYLDYPDYHDIVATAQRYLHGGALLLQPVIPPPDLNHCWYERRDGYAFYSLIYLHSLVVLSAIPYFLTAFLQWPEEWHDPPPTTLLNAFYPFLVAGGIALGVFIILVIALPASPHRAFCAPPTAMVCTSITAMAASSACAGRISTTPPWMKSKWAAKTTASLTVSWTCTTASATAAASATRCSWKTMMTALASRNRRVD